MANNEHSWLGILKISGQQAEKFLQGQLTCDVTALAPLQLGAHCNLQGRIISLFRIFRKENDFYLLMPNGLISIAETALKKYAVFFKVELSIIPDLTPFKIHLQEPDESHWQLNNIHNLIPTIYPETSAMFLPHELNLPALGAISFTKGCYTGQEIIARMQYKGKLKTHLYRAKGTGANIKRGSDIYSEKEIAGKIVDYCQVGYNNYELLIIAKESNTLSLDPENTELLEIIR